MKQMFILKIAPCLIALSPFLHPSVSHGNNPERLRIGLSLSLTGKYYEMADKHKREIIWPIEFIVGKPALR